MVIKRNTSVVAELELDEKSVYKQAIMGDDLIELYYTSQTPIKFNIGDFIMYNNKKFTLNNMPSVKKVSSREFNYNLKFEGLKYELKKTVVNVSRNSELFINGNADIILTEIVNQMNRHSSGWIKGACSVTDYYNFKFSTENCLQALYNVCETFDVEFDVSENKSINIRDRIGVDTNIVLEYKKGIKELSVEQTEELCTIAYGFSAKKNIPPDYGYDRIRAPYSSKFYSEYGYLEKIIYFEDIYPQFIGIIDSVVDTSFTDAAIDFNLNDYFLPGTVAKVVFLSGYLSGFEFEINTFDNTYKKVTLNYLNDDIGQTLPNTNLPIQTGDRYTFVDINMPPIYVTNTEYRLKEAVRKYLEKYSQPILKYTIQIDGRYLIKNNIVFNVGDAITVKDNDLAIDVKLRISSLTQSIANPNNLTIELTEQRTKSNIVELMRGQFDIQKQLDELRKNTKLLKNN